MTLQKVKITFILALACGLLLTTTNLSAQGNPVCAPVQIAQFASASHGNSGSAAWSPDGQYLVTDDLKFTNKDDQADGESISIYAADTLKFVHEINIGLTDSQGIFWSPRSDRFAYASLIGDGRIAIGHIDLYAAGSWAKTSLPDFDANYVFQQIGWSPDGKELAAVLYDRTHFVPNIQLGEAIRIWDASTNTLRAPITTALQQARVVSFKGQWYAAVRPADEDTLRVIRLKDGAVIFEDKGAYLDDFAASSTHMLLAARHLTSTNTSPVRVWDVETGTQLLETDNLSYLTTQLGTNPELLFVMSDIRSWHVYSLDAAAPGSFTFIDARRIALSPDGRMLAFIKMGPGGGGDAYSSGNGPIYILDPGDGATLATVPATNPDGMTWSPDSQFLVTTNPFTLWSLKECLPAK